MIGIIVKQWLKEYSTGLYEHSRDIARRRQYRYGNLEKWRVGIIVALIPVLLLVAAVLFLAGLLILLYNTHDTVARVVSVFVGLLFLFVILTTILPAIFRSCCYYSPQARAFFRLRNGVATLSRQASFLAFVFLVVAPLYLVIWIIDRSDIQAPMEVYHEVRQWVYSWFDPWMPVSVQWRSSEESSQLDAADLDINILLTAYSATLDVTTIDTSIAACVSERVGLRFWRNYIHRLEETIVKRYGQWERLPKRVHDVFRTAVQHMVKSLDVVACGNLQGINPQDTMSVIRVLELEEQDSEKSNVLCTMWKDLDLARDLQARARALVSMCCKTNARRAHEAFSSLREDIKIEAVRDPVTCRIGMYHGHLSRSGH